MKEITMENKKEIEDFIKAYDFLQKSKIVVTAITITFKCDTQDRVPHSDFGIIKNVIEHDLREMLNNQLTAEDSKGNIKLDTPVRISLNNYIISGIRALYTSTDRLEERIRVLLGLNKKTRKK